MPIASTRRNHPQHTINRETIVHKTAQITNPSINTYLLANLTPATWFFEVRAYTTANVESNASPVASKVID